MRRLCTRVNASCTVLINAPFFSCREKKDSATSGSQVRTDREDSRVLSDLGTFEEEERSDPERKLIELESDR